MLTCYRIPLKDAGAAGLGEVGVFRIGICFAGLRLPHRSAAMLSGAESVHLNLLESGPAEYVAAPSVSSARCRVSHE